MHGIRYLLGLGGLPAVPMQKTCRWLEASLWNLGYNQVDHYLGVYQPGGTGKVVVNRLAHHAQ